MIRGNLIEDERHRCSSPICLPSFGKEENDPKPQLKDTRQMFQGQERFNYMNPTTLMKNTAEFLASDFLSQLYKMLR